jgi:hypothetical protein
MLMVSCCLDLQLLSVTVVMSMRGMVPPAGMSLMSCLLQLQFLSMLQLLAVVMVLISRMILGLESRWTQRGFPPVLTGPTSIVMVMSMGRMMPPTGILLLPCIVGLQILTVMVQMTMLLLGST